MQQPNLIFCLGWIRPETLKLVARAERELSIEEIRRLNTVPQVFSCGDLAQLQSAWLHETPSLLARQPALRQPRRRLLVGTFRSLCSSCQMNHQGILPIELFLLGVMCGMGGLVIILIAVLASMGAGL